MSRINGSTPYSGIYRNNSVSPQKEKTSPQKTAGRYDTFRATQMKENTTDLKADTQQFLDSLQKSFPGVEITITAGSDLSLQDQAAQMGNGTHLIISQEFLDRMASSQEEFQLCGNLLKSVFSQLSTEGNHYLAFGAQLGKDGFTLWSVAKDENSIQDAIDKQNSTVNLITQMIEAMKTAKDASKNAMRVTTSPNSYDTAGTYSRVAQARTKGGVQTALGEARRKILSLQTASSFGTEKERLKAKAAIKSYQKLLQRGNRKIRKLNEEEITSIRKKRAMERKEEERAKKLEMAEQRMKRKRHLNNYLLVMEGKSSKKYIDAYRDDDKNPLSFLETGASSDIPISGGTGIEAGGSFTAADVSVSATIAF